ncbi:hypothetical protein, partial [Mycobacterium sp. E3247]|uniref:hypothetical protein n=1 Tax=Mycobacterium sp. E3247 TaxID=1856864 RepID=UPI000B232937
TSTGFAAGLAANAALPSGVTAETETPTGFTAGLAAKSAPDARARFATDTEATTGLAAKATTDTKATAGFTAKTPTDAVADLSAQPHRIGQLRAATQAGTDVGAEPSSSLTASRRRNV